MNQFKYQIDRKALVIFSGGMDSTVCLYWAIKEFGRENVSAITFDYGQRHQAEIESARKIAELAEVSWRLIEIPGILESTSPLLSDNKLEQRQHLEDFSQGLQPTFVPARNMLFFSIAANIAYELGAMNLVAGVCQADYGGYYDCRQEFVHSMQVTINEALFGHAGSRIQTERMLIHTPLMHLNKREEILFARSGFRTVAHIQERKPFVASHDFRKVVEQLRDSKLSILRSEDSNPDSRIEPDGSILRSQSRVQNLSLTNECFEALSHSHSCYAGSTPGCGKCHACHLRARAFELAGIADPLMERFVAA